MPYEYFLYKSTNDKERRHVSNLNLPDAGNAYWPLSCPSSYIVHAQRN